jgi:hypothetical protein
MDSQEGTGFQVYSDLKGVEEMEVFQEGMALRGVLVIISKK